MTKAEVTKLLTITAAMYPKFEISNIKIELWADLIGDIPFKVAQAALKKVMMTSEFPPTVAEIRKAAAEITTPKNEVMDAGQAWGEVQRALKKWGWPEPEKAMAMMSPLTQQVVKQISWREICMCEETGVIRGQFMKMYNAMQTRKEQDKLLPENFKNQIQLIAENFSIKQIAEASNDK
jgi:hypothetical protein